METNNILLFINNVLTKLIKYQELLCFFSIHAIVVAINPTFN